VYNEAEVLRAMRKSLFTFLGAALLATAAANASTPQQGTPPPKPLTEQAPVRASEKEVENHRIGKRPILRLQLGQPESSELAMAGTWVEVTVGPDGAVASAIGNDQLRESLRTQAEAAVRSLKYRPFERTNHPVRVSFREWVGVYPPELKPLWHTAFPTVHDWKSVVITLDRTGCLGTCPSYRVELHGDGTVLYDGRSFIAIEGRHRGTVPDENVRELVNQFRDADYYSLRNEYVLGVTDAPTYETSITIDGRLKKVKDYEGLQMGMPMAVSDLEISIDHLADTERWTKGNAETVPSLKEEMWNFKSSEAADTLTRLASFGATEAVKDMVAAGAPLNGRDRGSEEATLAQAAFHGDAEMVRVLLRAGAGSQSPREKGVALVSAALVGNIEIVRLLLRYGASPNSRDKADRTFLIAASASGVPAVVKEALKFHPNVNAQDKDGGTALIEAIGVLNHDMDRPEVDRATVVRLLLEAGSDPNMQDKNDDTALIDCAWNADAALLLIKAGAKVNVRDKYEITPLINAVTAEVTRVLLEHGADPSARDDGRTALEWAKGSGMKEKVAVLEAASAGMRPPDQERK